MNNLELVSLNIYKESDPVFGNIHLLSVRNKDGSDNITWSELQDFKNKMFGTNSQALEVYPKQDNLVDHANVRHLWIIDSNYKIPFSTGNI